MYSVIIYYLAKTLSELPQNILFPSITITIVYWLVNIHSSQNVFFQILFILVLASNTAVGYGTKQRKLIFLFGNHFKARRKIFIPHKIFSSTHCTLYHIIWSFFGRNFGSDVILRNNFWTECAFRVSISLGSWWNYQ